MNQPHLVEVMEDSTSLAAGADASILQEIAQPPIALAVWRRELEPSLCAWIDSLDPEALPHARFVASRPMAPDVVSAACADLPDSPEKTALAADIAGLVERFCAIMAASHVRVRLEAIEGDACRRFHQDAVEARLLCTYRGPATEWGYADPGAEPREIHALKRGDAAMCKGSSWRGAPTHRLVHRSPPIAGTGQARLLLVVDRADPAEDKEGAAHERPRGLQ